jgi:hypothetical protein
VAGTNGEPNRLYETREEVEEQASKKLTARFKIARDAPISEGQLFDDIGYLGDTASTKAILEGTYKFPPNMCPKTRLLCKLAHEIFSQKSMEDIATFIQTSDYQYYWKRANEFIQSSYSHIHFGHHKAAARDRYLSALEAAKLSLATRSGIPLERWGSALTVLLEKEFGNIYIKKMRAICLMEADFNWLNKLIFAKRMMDQAYDAGHVPLEQFAKRGTQAAHGVLCKVLFCDYVRALHIVAGIPSVDLGNCYDAVSHPIASIVLQAFKVPLLTVVLSLSVLQTMTFYLCTGYDVSKNGYGGTEEDPTFGLGQGNGMAPSGFTAVSTLMAESYKRLGHASVFAGAWSGIYRVAPKRFQGLGMPNPLITMLSQNCISYKPSSISLLPLVACFSRVLRSSRWKMASAQIFWRQTSLVLAILLLMAGGSISGNSAINFESPLH